MQDINKLCMNCMTDKGDESVCPNCSFDGSAENPLGYIPIKTELDGRYIVGSLIESNGEGATYIAWDKNNDTSVRIREYYPDKLASRDEDGVTVKVSTDSDPLYGTYLDEFLDLARKLADCKELTNLLPVTDIFEANGTAYYVTENIKSITLREFLLRNGGILTWDQFRPLITPVISTMSSLHAKGIIHRGISPETLLVGRDGVIRIVGFCVESARTEHSDLNAQLYPGYAAIEQYGFEGKQGTWTDVYSLTATIFRVLVGNPPPEATERVSNDRMIIPAKIVQSMPKNVINSMARGLAILADDRTKNMDKLKSNLIVVSGTPTGTTTVAVGAVSGKPITEGSATRAAKTDERKKDGSGKYVAIGLVAAILVFLIVLLIIWFFIISPIFFGKDDASDVATSSSAPVVTSEISSVEPTPGATTIVPDCMGKQLSEVLSDVNTALTLQFTVIEKNYNNEYARNQIFYQSIEAGTSVPEGTTVEIKISLGPSMIVVPNVKTMSLEEAKLTLIAAGFQFENIKVMQKEEPTVEFGKVVGTDIESGKKISADSSIIIYQSNSNPPAGSQPPSNSPSDPSTSSNSSTSSESSDPASDPTTSTSSTSSTSDE